MKIAPNGEFSDRANDRMVDLIDELAAGVGCEQPLITEAHMTCAIEIAFLLSIDESSGLQRNAFLVDIKSWRQSKMICPETLTGMKSREVR